VGLQSFTSAVNAPVIDGTRSVQVDQRTVSVASRDARNAAQISSGGNDSQAQSVYVLLFASFIHFSLIFIFCGDF
jgi:hypothetical protein